MSSPSEPSEPSEPSNEPKATTDISLAHDILSGFGTMLITVAAWCVDWRLGSLALGLILLAGGIVGMLNARKTPRS